MTENIYTETLNAFVNCTRDRVTGKANFGNYYLLAKLIIEVVDINVERQVNHIERKCNVDTIK